MKKVGYILLLILLSMSLAPLSVSAQCDVEGILLELQSTTTLSGLLIGKSGCVSSATVSSPLSYNSSTGTLSITAGSLAIVRDSSLSGWATTANPLGIRGYGAASNGQVPSKSTGGITWITPLLTEVDGSTTNELQNLSLSGQSLGISSGTGVTLPVVGVGAGTGISVVSTSGNVTVTNTGDLSATNELQTISNTSDATSHTATLSNSGGSWKLVEGTNISLTTSGTTADGVITISSTGGGNGIYGGSGSLPAGGSIVTTGGYPLGFNTNTTTGTERTILNMTTPYASDDAFTIWMRGVAGTALKDSFKLYNFDRQTHLYASGNLNLFSDNINIITGDSIQATTVPAITKMPAVMGITAGGVLKKMVGTTNGQVLTWNSGGWAPAAASSGGVTGTLTAGRVTLSAGASAVTDDADLLYDATTNRMQIGTGTASGFYNVVPTATLTGPQTGYYTSANVTGNLLTQQINTSTGSASNSGQILQVGSGAAGDPYTQYKIGTSTTTVTVGLDNDDVDKYKITPGGSVPGGVANSGLTVTNDSPPRVGIDRDAPVLELDINGRMRASYYSNSPSASFTISYSTGAGAASGSLISGGNNTFVWGFTTGASTTANGAVASITLPVSFFNEAIPVLFGANVNATNALANGLIYWDRASSSGSAVVFKANGQLPPSTSYLFSVNLGGY